MPKCIFGIALKIHKNQKKQHIDIQGYKEHKDTRRSFNIDNNEVVC